MDDRRFDALTRSLAAPKTRRGLLGGLLAFAAGALGASAQGCPPGQTANRKGDCSCPPGTDACPDGCFNKKTDPNNCGGCGRTCIGGECRKGECRCPSGSVLCDGVCRAQSSFADDPDNCGGCGVSCADGNACTTDICSGGACQNTPNTAVCTTAEGAAGTCANGGCVASTTTTTTTLPVCLAACTVLPECNTVTASTCCNNCCYGTSSGGACCLAPGFPPQTCP